MTSTTRFYHPPPSTFLRSELPGSLSLAKPPPPSNSVVALKTSNVKPAYVSYKNAGPTVSYVPRQVADAYEKVTDLVLRDSCRCLH
ncbi:hypothetical protein BC829DRAFT_447559 [Chytridium lagenaria]|nr:hypothetical protein BC829DRAFT_447559 [Chytridium lagenaria]